MKKKRKLRERQKKLLKKIAENLKSDRPKSLGKLAQESGYSLSTSQAVGRLIGTKSFQMALRKAGLNEEMIIEEYRKALKQKPAKSITWDVKLKWLQDVVKFLDLAPKEEGGKWQRIQAYIDKYLTIQITPEQLRALKEKKGKEIPKEFKDVDWDSVSAQEGEIKENETGGA